MLETPWDREEAEINVLKEMMENHDIHVMMLITTSISRSENAQALLPLMVMGDRTFILSGK